MSKDPNIKRNQLNYDQNEKQNYNPKWPSSSGKTSIMTEFKELAKECYCGIMMDGVHWMLPQKYLVYGEHSELDSQYPALTEDNKRFLL